MGEYALRPAESTDKQNQNQSAHKIMTKQKNPDRSTIWLSRDVKNRLDELKIARNVNSYNALLLDLLMEIDE